MSANRALKPVLAITIGDPAGIGPEIVLKSLSTKEVYDVCSPLVVGDAQTLAFKLSRAPLKIRPILNPAQAQYKLGTIDVLHIPSTHFADVTIGTPNKASGAISARSVERSITLAMTRLVRGVVHAPISKFAWKLAGIPYPGHTEYIAKLCGVKKVAMAISTDRLRTVLVTHHIPLCRVAATLKKESISEVIMIANNWMKQIGIGTPRIGICALNPHAGESGMLGKEEINEIAPAIKAVVKKLALKLFGPLPADSAYKQLKEGLYDCLVTMYHDQSLIPLKLYNADQMVNITLGLPFVRTSPGHGTAFDLAGKNHANPKPMIAAILTAAQLCKN